MKIYLFSMKYYKNYYLRKFLRSDEKTGLWLAEIKTQLLSSDQVNIWIFH